MTPTSPAEPLATPLTNPSPTLAQTLATLQAKGLARLDAQMLLLHVLGQPAQQRGWLLAHDTDLLPESCTHALDQLVQRRLAGEPVAYLTGHKAFFGLDLHVDARVLVPRPDTESLVDWALEVLPAVSISPALTRPRLLDMGTGSGAIALAIQSERPDVAVSALDASPDALAVAQTNAKRLGLDVSFQLSHWFEALAHTGARFECIASNPPYIADFDPHLAALTHEPLQALTSGADGLADLRQLVSQAPPFLAPGGWLLLEHGHDQAAAVRQLLCDAGFQQVQSRRDLAGIERCSGGQISPTLDHDQACVPNL